jgi:hypothetical protein
MRVDRGMVGNIWNEIVVIYQIFINSPILITGYGFDGGGSIAGRMRRRRRQTLRARPFNGCTPFLSGGGKKTMKYLITKFKGCTLSLSNALHSWAADVLLHVGHKRFVLVFKRGFLLAGGAHASDFVPTQIISVRTGVRPLI